MITVRVQVEDFDAGSELNRLGGAGEGTAGIGAISSFIGIVRGDGGLASLTLDHYPAMTERALQRLGELAAARWELSGATIIHRVGTMVPGDRIVFVGAASAHRAASLDACAYLIDALKTGAPFWKREIFEDGRSNWVEAKASDDQARARWD
jgi:molybdopterin synthase catalytic subunit